MEILFNNWSKLSLNKKFSTVIVVALAIPTIIILLLSFEEMRNDERENLSTVAMRDLEKIDALAQNNGNMASTVVQLVNTNPELTYMLYQKLTTAELIDFNTTVLPYFENIVITNPFIKNLRIYTNSDMIAERYPIIINKERIEDEEWYKNAETNMLKTRIGYSETLSEHITQLSDNALISYYQALEVYGGDKTVVEVSFKMSEFFGEVYNTYTNGVCLIKSGDEIFINDFGDEINSAELIDLVEQINEKEFSVMVKNFAGKEYLINHKQSNTLGFSYYIVNDLSQIFRELGITQVALFLFILIIFIILAFIFQAISNVLLSRIYETIRAMRKLECGDTAVKIANPSNDEIGELQKHFNNMVIKIDALIKQESKRAILEKDAEIKALQNQINSHFLYNVLNNIEMMAIIDNNLLIADTVTALARLLRYSMNWSKQFVPLTN